MLIGEPSSNEIISLTVNQWYRKIFCHILAKTNTPKTKICHAKQAQAEEKIFTREINDEKLAKGPLILIQRIWKQKPVKGENAREEEAEVSYG